MPKSKISAKYGSTVVGMDKKYSQGYQSQGHHSNLNQGNYHAANNKYQFSLEVNGRPKQDMNNYHHVTKNQYTSSKNSVMQSHDEMKTSHGYGQSQINDMNPNGYDNGSSDKGVQVSEQKQAVGVNTD